MSKTAINNNNNGSYTYNYSYDSPTLYDGSPAPYIDAHLAGASNVIAPPQKQGATPYGLFQAEGSETSSGGVLDHGTVAHTPVVGMT